MQVGKSHSPWVKIFIKLVPYLTAAVVVGATGWVGRLPRLHEKLRWEEVPLEPAPGDQSLYHRHEPCHDAVSPSGGRPLWHQPEPPAHTRRNWRAGKVCKGTARVQPADSTTAQLPRELHSFRAESEPRSPATASDEANAITNAPAGGASGGGRAGFISADELHLDSRWRLQWRCTQHSCRCKVPACRLLYGPWELLACLLGTHWRKFTENLDVCIILLISVAYCCLIKPAYIASTDCPQWIWKCNEFIVAT